MLRFCRLCKVALHLHKCRSPSAELSLDDELIPAVCQRTVSVYNYRCNCLSMQTVHSWRSASE